MGDVSTHSEIAQAVMPLLPAGEAKYFEIGNWITDVSQFRDPFAHLSGKRTFFLRAMDQFALIPRVFHIGDVFLGVDDYLDEVLGVPPETRERGRRPGPDPAGDRPDDGALARWLRGLFLLVTCNPELSPPLRSVMPLDKNEVKQVFDVLYTQYFPHEHLDFPPLPPHLPQRGDRNPSQVPVTGGGQPRRVLAYVDQHLDYIADLLTRVERDWAHAAAQGADPARRRELVARFGHASHALEDWFFHSNFVEMAWRTAHATQPAPHAPLPPPTPAEIEHHGPVASDTTVQRRYRRRLRAPSFQGDGDQLSRETSQEAALVYTSSFGADDISFTLIDALGHVLGVPPDAVDPAVDPKRALLSRLLHPLHRAFYGTEQEREESLKQWKADVMAGTWVARAQTLRRLGLIEEFELQTITEMNELERRLYERYSCIGLGIVGLLQKVIETAQSTVKKSFERSREIDGDAAHSIQDDRTDNGAPGENIGSHSLMAKDSIRKEPLRGQTVNLAKSVATYVATTMAGRLASAAPTRPDDFVDWAELLRFFVTHPEQASGGAGNEWWRPVLDAQGPVPPQGHTVVLKTAAEIGDRAGEPHLAALEQPYYDAAVYAEERYKETVDHAMILNSAYTGAIFGAITGLVSALVNSGEGAGNKTLSALSGLVVGALVAGGSGTLLALLGLAISRHAGVVTGSYLGIAGGLVAAVFAAGAVARAIDV
jgi:hypothetical protein